jgi:hypothetical protein
MRPFVPALAVLLVPIAAACSRSPSEPPATADPTPPRTSAASTTPSAPAMIQAPKAPAAAAAASTNDGHSALHWDDPPRWKRRTPSTPMRKVEYLVPRAAGDSEDGECFVITFGPNQGGGVDENIERWVKQLQPTTSAVDRSKHTVNGMNVTRVEVAGTYAPMAMPSMPASSPRPGSRLVGEIVEAPSGTWFFKMTGPDATVKAAARELDALIDSVRPD